MLLKLKTLIKNKYNKDIKDLNCKQILNIIRHNKLDEDFRTKYNTKNLGEALYLAQNNIPLQKCYCGNSVKFINNSIGYRKFCSVKCMANSKAIINKKIDTNNKIYGTDFGLQNAEIRKKIKHTNIMKFGFDNPAKSQAIKNKITSSKNITNKKIFFDSLITGDRLNNIVEPMFTLSDYKTINYQYLWKCCKCNKEFKSNLISGKIPYCPECNKSYASKYEKEISTWLSKIEDDIIINDRTIIHPLELDIVIPSKKIAIEFNGLYWHSESKGKNKNYHLNKTNQCNEKGYQLIHIFEDEWAEKSEIVKSIIKAKLGIFDQKIYGRKCQIKKIDRPNSIEFLNNNHIQGFINGTHIGLFYQNELVALATFGKSRHNKNYDIELLRFCSKLNTQVLGGLSKLIKAWKNEYPNKTLISYADKRYSNGIGYELSGFKLVHNSNPNYYYLINGHRESRMKYQKHKLSKLLENFNSELTEWQNMQLNGYDRIWDCGNYVFEKTI